MIHKNSPDCLNFLRGKFWGAQLISSKIHTTYYAVDSMTENAETFNICSTQWVTALPLKNILKTVPEKHKCTVELDHKNEINGSLPQNRQWKLISIWAKIKVLVSMNWKEHWILLAFSLYRFPVEPHVSNPELAAWSFAANDFPGNFDKLGTQPKSL